jgi:hypothetical protein|tara:strand:- start:857 stop:1981 length:1125 start_codon:yes stop_codon:yes gene_type:complete
VIQQVIGASDFIIFASLNTIIIMKFKIGDKVKFIDEIGGGIVTGIVDSKLVKVKTDDGFEMPVLSIDLIPDHRALPAMDNSPQIISNSEVVAEPEKEPDFISPINPWRKVEEEEGVYLGFEPHEQQWLLTGDVDVVLANNTPYELLYSLFLNREQTEGIDFSSIPAESKIVIETISREELEDWKSGYIQVLFHADKPKKVFLPVHSAIDIKSARFFKEGSYKDNTIFNGKAIIINIASLGAIPCVTASNSELKDDSYVTESKATSTKKKQLVDKYRSGSGEALVDLHIGELLDNILGLSSKDMLDIQVDTFNKILSNAIENEYNKVTFIHGVGNGVLKSTIINELKNYEGLKNSMASIAKFGVGAIDITINYSD